MYYGPLAVAELHVLRSLLFTMLIGPAANTYETAGGTLVLILSLGLPLNRNHALTGKDGKNVFTIH